MDYETDAISRTPAKENPWFRLMLYTKILDLRYDKPSGYYWFWALEHLHVETKEILFYNFLNIQLAVPDGHWLQEIPPLESHDKYIPDDLKTTVKNFAASFKNQNEIGAFDFTKLRFTFPADFSNFIFPMDVSFEYSIFRNHANFSNAIFLNNVYCSNVNFHRNAIFLNANFFKTADFNETTITGQIDFTKARFKETAPLFHNATLNPDVIWDSATWPEDTKNKAVIRNNQNAYETLAHLMEGLDKQYDQHLFYRQEMRCRRWLAKNPFTISAYWLYEKLANYGYGFERALACWGLHILLGGLFIWSITKDAACSFLTSFANAHGFLFFNNGPLEKCYDVFVDIPIFKIIWGTQTIIGIVLLFLLLLTLRIRFRLK